MNGIALRVSTRWLPFSTSTTGVHRRDDVGISATNAKLLAICLWDTPKADAALAAVAKDPATGVVVHWEFHKVSLIKSVPVQNMHGCKQHAAFTRIAKRRAEFLRPLGSLRVLVYTIVSRHGYMQGASRQAEVSA